MIINLWGVATKFYFSLFTVLGICHRYGRPWLDSQSIPSAGVTFMMNPRWRRQRSTGKKLAINRIYFGNVFLMGVLDVKWKLGAEFFKKILRISYS